MTTIIVTVVLALPDRAVDIEVRLPEGATAAAALARFPAHQAGGVDLATAPIGVWGRRVERSHMLADGDRLEIYRPLVADPKTARHRRARRPTNR
jgi:putative ubiquitin-RnfH superfamily antitoxin RatB of RatAB toxin-antitoxin module